MFCVDRMYSKSCQSTLTNPTVLCWYITRDDVSKVYLVKLPNVHSNIQVVCYNGQYVLVVALQVLSSAWLAS